MRGSQAARAGALAAIPQSVALGTVQVSLPILLAGLLLIALAAFLALVMTEEGFTPVRVGDRIRWQKMVGTVADARGMIVRQPVLLSLLAIGLFYGLYSEGLDRLWTAHLLESFRSPLAGLVAPVVWVVAVRAVLAAASIGVTELVGRRVDVSQSVPIGRALVSNAMVIILSLAAFGLTQNFWLAVAFFWILGTARKVAEPLQIAWFNLRIDDSQVRATLFSICGQVDAIG